MKQSVNVLDFSIKKNNKREFFYNTVEKLRNFNEKLYIFNKTVCNETLSLVV